ncbi:hypothetical protein C8R47DRAFT_915875, partial [Mycena vitilis]
QRNESGVYDSFANQIEAMGAEALANLEYPEDITRHVEWSGNYKYLGKDGNELRVSIVGKILGPSQGTMMRAQGNFFARNGDNFQPVDDKTKIKDTIALGIPTCSTVRMHNTVVNQIICATQITTADADEFKRKGEVRTFPFIRTAKRKLDDAEDLDNIYVPKKSEDVAVPAGKQLRALNLTRPILITFVADDIKLGAFYEPALLSDFGGDYFNLIKNKLVQHDIRDIRGALVPPWKIYEELRPGTLVLVLVSLHCFKMGDESNKDGRERRIYHMSAESIRVIAESDEYVEPRDRPIPPNAKRVTASLPARATDSFSNFVV